MSWSLGQATGPLGPYRGAKAVTGDDANDLPSGICQAIYASGAGNVAVILENGDAITLALLTGYAGKQEFLIRRVKSTGTTATGIVALYV